MLIDRAQRGEGVVPSPRLPRLSAQSWTYQAAEALKPVRIRHHDRVCDAEILGESDGHRRANRRRMLFRHRRGRELLDNLAGRLPGKRPRRARAPAQAEARRTVKAENRPPISVLCGSMGMPRAEKRVRRPLKTPFISGSVTPRKMMRNERLVSRILDVLQGRKRLREGLVRAARFRDHDESRLRDVEGRKPRMKERASRLS